jgi:hypothetical protein
MRQSGSSRAASAHAFAIEWRVYEGEVHRDDWRGAGEQRRPLYRPGPWPFAAVRMGQDFKARAYTQDDGAMRLCSRRE